MVTESNLQISDNPFAKKLGVREWQEKELVQPKMEEYLIEGMIPANSLVSLKTDNVYGKTTLAVQLAMTVAFDVPFLGSYPCLQPGKVLFLNTRDTDEDSHRRFKRLVREWSHGTPDLNDRIEANLNNFTHISLFDDCYQVSPHLIDISGSMTKTYTYLYQFSHYYKTKLIVLDPVEDFFPPNLKNIAELYLKLRQLQATVLLVIGDRERNEAFHEVEVGMFLHENSLQLQSVYTGHKEYAIEMGAGIWTEKAAFNEP
jgi:RecA-family ATPase